MYWFSIAFWYENAFSKETFFDLQVYLEPVCSYLYCHLNVLFLIKKNFFTKISDILTPPPAKLNYCVIASLFSCLHWELRTCAVTYSISFTANSFIILLFTGSCPGLSGLWSSSVPAEHLGFFWDLHPKQFLQKNYIYFAFECSFVPK